MDNGFVARARVATVAAMAYLRDLLRQGRQNKNDIEELYRLNTETNMKVNVIAEVQQEHGRRLDSIEGRLDNIEVTHGGKLDEILGILRKVP